VIWFLRGLALTILASMLAITSWAGAHTPLFAIPREVFLHPWFLATLLDAYWAFVSFYVWIAWKEQSFAARALWLVAVLALGNIAMAIYALRELGRVPATTPLAEVITRRHRGSLPLPATLAALGVAVYLFA
jgi:hypothetical protein